MRQIQQSGLNSDIDIASAEDVWSQQGDINFPTTAAATTIVSSDADDADGDTGSRTVRVVGLDSDLKEVSEIVTMDGTNAVTLVNQLLRFLYAEVLTAGSSGANEGTIDIKHSSTVIGQIPAGANRSRGAFFTAPEMGHGRLRTKVKKVYVAITDATNGIGNFTVLTRKSGGLWQTRAALSVHGTSKPSDQMHLNLDLDPGEDVKVRCAVTADNTEVTADLQIVTGSLGEISKQY